jgi:hypothetical protein
MLDQNVSQVRNRKHATEGLSANHNGRPINAMVAEGSPETNTADNPDTTPYKVWMGNDPVHLP